MIKLFNILILSVLLMISVNFKAYSESLLIDDFEGQAIGIAPEKWEIFGPIKDKKIEIIDGAAVGKRAVRLDFGRCPGKWGGIYKWVKGSEWKNYNVISFWVKGDGSNRNFIVTLTVTKGDYSDWEIWESKVPLKNKEWHKVNIFLKLTETIEPYPCFSDKQNGKDLDISEINRLDISVGGLSEEVIFFIDEIKLESEEQGEKNL